MFHIRMWRKYFSSFRIVVHKSSEMDIFALWEMLLLSSRECIQCQNSGLSVLKCWTIAVTDTSVLVCLEWFYVYFIISTERMPRGENRPSILLSRDENDQVFSLIGPKCQVRIVNPAVFSHDSHNFQITYISAYINGLSLDITVIRLGLNGFCCGF